MDSLRGPGQLFSWKQVTVETRTKVATELDKTRIKPVQYLAWPVWCGIHIKVRSERYYSNLQSFVCWLQKHRGHRRANFLQVTRLRDVLSVRDLLKSSLTKELGLNYSTFEGKKHQDRYIGSCGYLEISLVSTLWDALLEFVLCIAKLSKSYWIFPFYWWNDSLWLLVCAFIKH